MPTLTGEQRLDFLRRQVLTSRNVRGGWFTDVLLGGLNYQIEHHLFPSMPTVHLRRAQVIRRQYSRRDRGAVPRDRLPIRSYREALTHPAPRGERPIRRQRRKGSGGRAVSGPPGRRWCVSASAGDEARRGSFQFGRGKWQGSRPDSVPGSLLCSGSAFQKSPAGSTSVTTRLGHRPLGLDVRDGVQGDAVPLFVGAGKMADR